MTKKIPATRAEGVLRLIGPWTQEDLDKLLEVKDVFLKRTRHRYWNKITVQGSLMLENREVPFQAEGEWPFSFTLGLVQDRMVESVSKGTLTGDQSRTLKDALEQGNLSLELDFTQYGNWGAPWDTGGDFSYQDEFHSRGLLTVEDRRWKSTFLYGESYSFAASGSDYAWAAANFIFDRLLERTGKPSLEAYQEFECRNFILRWVKKNGVQWVEAMGDDSEYILWKPELNGRYQEHIQALLEKREAMAKEYAEEYGFDAPVEPGSLELSSWKFEALWDKASEDSRKGGDSAERLLYALILEDLAPGFEKTLANWEPAPPRPRFIPEEFDNRFEGRRFLIACHKTLDGYTKEQAAEFIRKFGGELEETLTPETDFLVIGDGVGEPWMQAMEYGTCVLTAARLEAMMK